MKKFNSFLLAMGVGLFVFTLAKLGLQEVTHHLYMVGWGIGAIVLLRIISQTIFTYSWAMAFQVKHHVPFFTLMQTRLAGEAINYLLPSAGMAGEPLKARLLSPYMNFSSALASTTVAKYSFILAQLLMMIVGGVVVLLTLELSPSMRMGVIAPLLIISTGLGVLYFAQQRGLFHGISGIFVRWKIARTYLLTRAEGLKRLDRAIAGIYKHQRRDFFFSILLNIFGWMEGIVEVYMILVLLNLHASLGVAFLIESMSLVINAAFFFVPWQAGTQEAGKAIIFQTVGLGSTAGFALGIIRRFRELIWVGIGLLCLAILKERAEVKGQKAEVLEGAL